jgi:hypothetical protein
VFENSKNAEGYAIMVCYFSSTFGLVSGLGLGFRVLGIRLGLGIRRVRVRV